MNTPISPLQRARQALRPARRFLREARHRLLRRLGVIGESWEAGVPKELQFWENALKDPDRNWIRSEFEERLNPDLDLQVSVKAFIAAPPGATVQILDVGAGPLTRLGKRWEGRQVQICPIDPLAGEYKAMLARLGIHPPVFTETGQGEKLLNQFAKNSFDLAFASNSLDHSRDPMLAIRNMFAVVKPQGGVYLWHFAHVGVGEDYTGLHQWNFDRRGSDMILSDGRGTRYSLAREFKSVGALECETEPFFDETVVVAKLKKLTPS